MLLGLYGQGRTAEELHHEFPTLALADIHATIAYYLGHKDEVDAYLKERERIGDEIQAMYESEPGYKALTATILRRAEERGLLPDRLRNHTIQQTDTHDTSTMPTFSSAGSPLAVIRRALS